MTGLNIQSPTFLGDGVIIWQVFIRILRYYGSKAVGRTVKIFPLLGEEFIRGQEVRQVRGQAGLEGRRRYEGRLFKLLKGLFFISLAPLGRGLERGANQEDKLYSRWMIGCHDVKLLSVLRTKIASVIDLPSCHLFLCSSDCYPPQPSLIREGACVDWCGTLPCNDIMNLIPSLERRGSKGVGESQPSPQPIGEGISKKLLKHRCQSDILKPLKQVQDDLFNLLKSTYSPIHLFTYSLRKKAAFTLAEGATHVATSNKIRRAAFTLAEVLITLGIIGVVAALTIPTLMANHRKTVIETRLAKFYSTMNQAVQRAEVDYGDKTLWEKYEMIYEKDEDGNDDKTKPIVNTAYFNKYFAPYIVATKMEEGANGGVIVYFPDGSVASFSSDAIHFWPNGKDFNGYQRDDETGLIKNDMEASGRKYFTFFFSPTSNTTANKYHYAKGVEPYKYNWDGTEDMLRNYSSIGCKENVSNERAYCTALIQMNGWKIPKDYPIRL